MLKKYFFWSTDWVEDGKVYKYLMFEYKDFCAQVARIRQR